MGIMLSGVSYRYRNQQFLFEGLDLSVAAGAKVSLVGDNGTGKSTLLKLIAGELAPSSGSIVCPSRPYYVPQQAGIAGISVARALGVDGKVEALRAICAGSTDAACYDILADDWEVEARCRAALDGWGLPHVGLDSPVDTLSGGEKTRLLLAGVAVHAPAVILLDEPTAFLDLPNRYEICLLLRKLAHTQGKSIIFSTHDLNIALELCDTIALIEGGSIRYGTREMLVADGTFERLFDGTSLRFDPVGCVVRLRENESGDTSGA